MSEQEDSSHTLSLVAGLSGAHVYTANIGRAINGTLVMYGGVYSSRRNADIALRRLLPAAQALCAERTLTEDDFDIEVDQIDPHAEVFGDGR